MCLCVCVLCPATMASLWTRFTRAIGAKDSTVAVTAAVAAAALGGVLVWQSGALEWAMAEVGLRLSRAASRRRKNRRPQYIILVRHGESIVRGRCGGGLGWGCCYVAAAHTRACCCTPSGQHQPIHLLQCAGSPLVTDRQRPQSGHCCGYQTEEHAGGW